MASKSKKQAQEDLANHMARQGQAIEQSGNRTVSTAGTSPPILPSDSVAPRDPLHEPDNWMALVRKIVSKPGRFRSGPISAEMGVKGLGRDDA